MNIRELTTKEDMLRYLPVMQELYPKLTHAYYDEMLTRMLPHNYGQIGVFDGETCLGISGYWYGTKLWCGPYLELDNVIVIKAARGTGAGKLLSAYLDDKAKELGCHIMTLDAYTSNFKAHRFYYNQGYAPRGFHFIKLLEAEKLT
jgi:GNAT superfamily N-acetyltransferase